MMALETVMIMGPHFLASMATVLTFAWGARRASVAKKLRQLGCVVVTPGDAIDAGWDAAPVHLDAVVIDTDDPEEGFTIFESFRQKYPLPVAGVIIVKRAPGRQLRKSARAAKVEFIYRSSGLRAVRAVIEQLTRGGSDDAA